MKRYYITTIVICLVMVLGFSFYFHVWDKDTGPSIIRVGFLSENDEMISSTYNFFQSKFILEKEFPDHVEIISRTNVREDETEEAVRELVRSGCSIIFVIIRPEIIREIALSFPEIQFCQISTEVNAAINESGNFHTFNAKNHQLHYIDGVAAGLKLRELIDNGTITSDEALVGYIGAFPTPEIISGFTAFLLGVRSEAPEAVMRVRYVNSIGNFSKEKANAKALIDEGCVIIANNSGTAGAATACQEAAVNKNVYHIGFNENINDSSSSVSLVNSRINWDPYVTGAVRSLLQKKPIEQIVIGDVHGNDICAGFEQNWLEITDVNENIAAEGTSERISQVIDDIIKNKVDIFRGNYSGVDFNNKRLKIDLNDGFAENSRSSKPTFHYILKDIITVEKTDEG